MAMNEEEELEEEPPATLQPPGQSFPLKDMPSVSS